MAEPARGRIVVISGPSGVGKTTVVRRLRECSALPLDVAVSATTRPARPGEINGVDYHFMTAEEFQRRRQGGEFVECFEVFGGGHWYGTLWSEITPRLEAGRWVVLGIDVHGAEAVRQRFPEAITIFLKPGSLEQLEKQLRGRRTEPDEAIQRRLAEAERELAQAERFQFQVVNDTVDHAVGQICQILMRSGG